jgi:predicted permease
MSGSTSTSNITVQGYAPRADEETLANHLLTGPNYCETLGVPLLAGREIGPRDTAASQQIAMVNQAFADRYLKGQNPLGRKFNVGDKDESAQIEIVGVIGNIKPANAREWADPTFYRPILQVQDQSTYAAAIQIRTANNPAALAPLVRQAINQTDEKLPIFGVTTLSEQLQGTLRQDRLIAQLVSFFGALALVLACVGLYGVMAHGVARRTKEIGIRMALGAARRDIAWMVLRETLLLVLAGLALGIPTAWAAARLVSSQLFGMNPGDPVTLLGAALLLTIVAVLAGYLPARRAARVNPLIALRYE